jgi:hypothetical protein
MKIHAIFLMPEHSPSIHAGLHLRTISGKHHDGIPQTNFRRAPYLLMHPKLPFHQPLIFPLQLIVSLLCVDKDGGAGVVGVEIDEQSWRHQRLKFAWRALSGLQAKSLVADLDKKLT